jgi:ammonia channel protein AmtB
LLAFQLADLKRLDATIGLRIEQEGEDIGLDLSEQGEKAYKIEGLFR